MSSSSFQAKQPLTQESDIPTFYIEIETVEPEPSKLRVKLVEAPDDEGESKTYWMKNPLLDHYANEKALGQTLYHCLFGEDDSNEIGQRFRHYYNNECSKKPQGGNVCLRILLSFSSIKGRAENAVSFPWELLHDGSTWLGLDPRISIARRTTTIHPYKQKTDASLRILLVYAEPKIEALASFDGKNYLNHISDVFQSKEKAINWLDLVQLPHANRYTFEQKIKEGFHIIHFLGHGETTPSQTSGLDAYLHLEDTEMPGTSDKLSAKTLATWFREARMPPKLVVLMACQSGISDRFSVLGTAQSLLASGVSAVVAFQAKLGQKEAGWFAEKFYENLASHTSVDGAVQAGRNALNNLYAKSLHSGAERSLIGLLKTKSMTLSATNDMRQLIETKTKSNDLEPLLQQSQTVKFPAWALPILLLNGDSWLGQEQPPSLIWWTLQEYNICIEMVYIPEGNFYIDKYPVILADYNQISSNPCNPNWIESDDVKMYSNYPAANIFFKDAETFALKTGRRLPSVEEWQQAALSGIDDKQQRYPWGNEFRLQCNTSESKLFQPMSVKAEAEKYKDNTNPSGMCGIIGNVSEFARGNDEIYVCGGAFMVKGTNVNIQSPGKFSDKRKTSKTGFRCIAKWPDIKQAQRDGKLTSPLSNHQENIERWQNEKAQSF